MEKVKLESICEKFFGITSRRYRQLADEGYVPQPERGLVDPLDAAKGLLTYYRELSEGGSDLNEARKEKVLVETELKRLQLLVEKKELIPRGEILQGYLDRIGAVKSGLTHLHRILPEKLEGKDQREMSAIIKEAVEDLLTKYSTPPGGILKQIIRGEKK